MLGEWLPARNDAWQPFNPTLKKMGIPTNFKKTAQKRIGQPFGLFVSGGVGIIPTTDVSRVAGQNLPASCS